MFEVALAADEAYVPHAATVLRSMVLLHDARTVRAHFLHPVGLPEARKAPLRDMLSEAGAQIVFHPVSDESVKTLPAMGRITQVMWYRMLLPELLPDVQRILYLDCDTLVVDDLRPLWDLDMGEAWIGAVGNVFPPDLRNRPEKLGLAEDRYFNSGVLLIDLDRWRSHDVAQHVMSEVFKRPELIQFPDQDALNLVLADHRCSLHPRWNCQNSMFAYPWAEDIFGAGPLEEARSDPAIVHFEGPLQVKPWYSRTGHPYQRAYIDLRAQTPWPMSSFEIEGRRGNVLRRVLRLKP